MTTPATTSSDNGAQFAVAVSNTAGLYSNAATLTGECGSGGGYSGSSKRPQFWKRRGREQRVPSLDRHDSGTATLNITQVAASGSVFTISGFSLPLNVSAGQQTTNLCCFPANLRGAATGNISIVSNAPTSPTSVGLSGRRMPPRSRLALVR